MTFGTIVCLLLAIYSVGCNDDFDVVFNEYTKSCTCEQKLRILTVNYTNQCTEFRPKKLQRDFNSVTVSYMQLVEYPYRPVENAGIDNYHCIKIENKNYGSYQLTKYTALINLTNGPNLTEAVFSFVGFEPRGYPGHQVVVGTMYGACTAYHRVPLIVDEDGYGIISCLALSDEYKIDSPYVATRKEQPTPEELRRYRRPIEKAFNNLQFKRIIQECDALEEDHEPY